MTVPKERQWMILWDMSSPEQADPTQSRLLVVKYPYGSSAMSKPWGLTGSNGDCSMAFQEMDYEQRADSLLGMALWLITGYGIAWQEVFREFSKIREWRDMWFLLPDGPARTKAFIDGDYTKLNPHNPG